MDGAVAHQARDSGGRRAVVAVQQQAGDQDLRGHWSRDRFRPRILSLLKSKSEGWLIGVDRTKIMVD